MQEETRQLIMKARKKGITLKQIASICEISVNTLYQFNSQGRNMTKEKVEKVYNALLFLLNI